MMQSQAKARDIAAAMTEKLLRALPGLAAWYSVNSELTLLSACARDLQEQRTGPSEAVIQCLARRTEAVLGQGAAVSLTRRLRKDATVLAANHHGINSHPEFFQATHFFGLPELLAPDAQGSVIPVLACSTVTLRSYSFPRGLLLGRAGRDTPWLRLPLFPAALSDVMAGAAPALGLEDCRNAAKNWNKLDLCAWEREVAQALLEEYVQTDEVLGQPNFSAQATLLNARLWADIFGDKPGPGLVYLDLEEIATELLIQEFTDSTSLFSLLLCNVGIRRELFGSLAGVPGCWDQAAARKSANGEIKGGGSAFFWFKDAKGRRYPLFLEEGASPALCHEQERILLHPAALSEALQTQRIVPGLFCSYVVLSLMHRLELYGGMYMIDYLPAMTRGVLHALKQGGYADFMGQGSARPEKPRLGSALMPAYRCLSGGRSTAGLLEFMHAACAGHVYRDALVILSERKVAELFPFSVAAWYQECFPPQLRTEGWEEGTRYLLENGVGVEI